MVNAVLMLVTFDPFFCYIIHKQSSFALIVAEKDAILTILHLFSPLAGPAERWLGALMFDPHPGLCPLLVQDQTQTTG